MATGRRTGKQEETRHSYRMSDRQAKGRQQAGNRANGNTEATGKVQQKETGERQESDRVFFGDRKAERRQQGCARRATDFWKTTSETK